MLKDMLNDSGLLNNHGFINGQWVSAASGEEFDVYNPATGESIAKVADLSAKDTEQAIAAANNAMKVWKSITAQEKSVYLRRWFELVMANQEDLALIMTYEQGKVLAEARGEVAYGASYIEWFAEEAKRIYGDVLPSTTLNRRSLVMKQPIGVVGAITPWNFPIAMITRKVAPALAAGCAIVLKPAAETPLSALALAELSVRAGIPKGLFNVIPSTQAEQVGQALTDNALVKKVTFTGSTRVGKILMAQSANTVKRTSMELGGNAPVIVFDDADLDKAVDGVFAAKFRNAGQTCICVNRVLVHSAIHDEFLEKLSLKVQQMVLGNGLHSQSTIGPLITEKAVQNVMSLVDDAITKGASIYAGGETYKGKGHFYIPTIVSGLDQTMRLAKEEVFGPVASIFQFSTDEQAIQMANDTEFGLAAYVYTKSQSRSWRVSEDLEYGMVGVNETSISSEMIPFGGIKESGQGREGSKYGLEDYLETKYLCLGDI